MDFEDSRLLRAIYDLPFHKVAAKTLDLSESGRDVTQRDAKGRGFLHHIANLGEKFNQPQSVAVVYQLALAGIDLNAVDCNGDTALHVIARTGTCHRLLVAMIRY